MGPARDTYGTIVDWFGKFLWEEAWKGEVVVSKPAKLVLLSANIAPVTAGVSQNANFIAVVRKSIPAVQIVRRVLQKLSQVFPECQLMFPTIRNFSYIENLCSL